MKFEFSNLRTPRTTPEEEIIRSSVKQLVDYFEGENYNIPVADFLSERIPNITFNNNIQHGGHHESRTGNIRISPLSSFPHPSHASKILTHELSHGISKKESSMTGSMIVSEQDPNQVIIPIAAVRSGTVNARHKQRSGLSHEIVRATSNGRFGMKENVFSFFEGFNEGLTDKIAYEILGNEMSYEQFASVDGNAYTLETAILCVACDSIASSNNLETNHVFKLFVRSYIFGWQKELKELIYKTFGPNGLRVMAVMEARGYGKHTNKWTDRDHAHHSRRLWNLFKPFFDITVPQRRREEIARMILKRTGIPYKK